MTRNDRDILIAMLEKLLTETRAGNIRSAIIVAVDSSTGEIPVLRITDAKDAQTTFAFFDEAHKGAVEFVREVVHPEGSDCQCNACKGARFDSYVERARGESN